MPFFLGQYLFLWQPRFFQMMHLPNADLALYNSLQPQFFVSSLPLPGVLADIPGGLHPFDIFPLHFRVVLLTPLPVLLYLLSDISSIWSLTASLLPSPEALSCNWLANLLEMDCSGKRYIPAKYNLLSHCPICLWHKFPQIVQTPCLPLHNILPASAPLHLPSTAAALPHLQCGRQGQYPKD